MEKLKAAIVYLSIFCLGILLFHLSLYVVSLQQKKNQVLSVNKMMTSELSVLARRLDIARLSLEALSSESLAFNQQDEPMLDPFETPDLAAMPNPLQNMNNILGHLDSMRDIIQLSHRRANSIPSLLPTQGEVNSDFGVRISPITGGKQFHKGLDIVANIGTPIFAAATGRIIFATRKGPYGKMVSVEHEFGFNTRYAHLSKFYVEKGQKVKRGQLIAAVGNTGRVTGPHLHYEVLLFNHHLNPLPFIKDAQFSEHDQDLAQTSHPKLNLPPYHESENEHFETPVLIKISLLAGVFCFLVLLLLVIHKKVQILRSLSQRFSRARQESLPPKKASAVRYWGHLG